MQVNCAGGVVGSQVSPSRFRLSPPVLLLRGPVLLQRHLSVAQYAVGIVTEPVPEVNVYLVPPMMQRRRVVVPKDDRVVSLVEQ